MQRISRQNHTHSCSLYFQYLARLVLSLERRNIKWTIGILFAVAFIAMVLSLIDTFDSLRLWRIGVIVHIAAV